eukprot:COSAG02_NODE_394_length_23152_cov_13.232204_12_plen_289_part_00
MPFRSTDADQVGWGYSPNQAAMEHGGEIIEFNGAENATASDKIVLTLDCDAGTLTVSKNGQMMGVMASGLAGKTLCWCVVPGAGADVRIRRTDMVEADPAQAQANGRTAEPSRRDGLVSAPPEEWPECGVRAGGWALQYKKGGEGQVGVEGALLVNFAATPDRAGVIEIVAASSGWFRAAKNSATGDGLVEFDTGRADMFWGDSLRPNGTQSFSVEGHLTTCTHEFWHACSTNPPVAAGSYSVGGWTFVVEADGMIHVKSPDVGDLPLRLLPNGEARIGRGVETGLLW